MTQLNSIEYFLPCPLRQASAKTKGEAAAALPFDDASFNAFLVSNMELKEGFGWKFKLDGISASMDAIASFPFNFGDRCFIGEDAGPRPFPRPTLFLRGGDSDYVSAADIPTAAQWFPSYYFHSIRGAGHWLHAERPTETAATLARFISSTKR
jgi:pimeloyl-ACP methyl ester carboxylesterase